jgi:hypothetical protein
LEVEVDDDHLQCVLGSFPVHKVVLEYNTKMFADWWC